MQSYTKIECSTQKRRSHENSRMRWRHANRLPKVSVLCLTAGGALIFLCNGFGLVLMSFFNFHFSVGSDTACIHKKQK